MTFSEFKAWLDGFNEAIDGAPTEEQWQRIMEKMEQVVPDTRMIPEPVPQPVPRPQPVPAPYWGPHTNPGDLGPKIWCRGTDTTALKEEGKVPITDMVFRAEVPDGVDIAEYMHDLVSEGLSHDGPISSALKSKHTR